MSLINMSFWGLGLLIVLVAGYGIRLYKTVLNPLTVFAFMQMGLITLLSAIVAVNWYLYVPYDSSTIIQTLIVSFVYMVGSLVPYFFKTPRLLFIFYQKLLGLAKLRSKSIARNLSTLKLVLILLAILISFSSLAIFGGGGIQWVTNPRDAYISNRTGVGPLYSLTQWLIMFAFIYYIFATKAKSIKLISSLIFFTCLMFFLGAKSNILALTVVAVTYSNFYVKKIPNFAILLGVPLLFVGSLFLLIVQSSYSDLSDSVLYFKDYFDTTAQMMSRFDEFGGFHYGGALLSSLWFFVPRGLYPNKPYEYGETLIHQVLFPGATETGNTPGLLPWSMIYLDFGIVGVFFWGFFISLFQKTCYEYFLKNRESFFAFSLGINFSIWNIWIFAPPIFVLILSALQSIFLKSFSRLKVIRTRNSM